MVPVDITTKFPLIPLEVFHQDPGVFEDLSKSNPPINSKTKESFWVKESANVEFVNIQDLATNFITKYTTNPT